MSGTDDAVTDIVNDVFDQWGIASRRVAADAVVDALRAAGHLRTPGTVEVSRSFEAYHEMLMRLRAALAAGADDGE